MSRKNRQLGSSALIESYSRDSSTAKYMRQRHRRGRRKVLAGVGIGLLVFLFAGVGLAWAYVSNINHRLTNNVTAETRETLADAVDGEPFYMLLIGIDKDESRSHSSQYGASDNAYRSDSIMVARIDPTERKVTLLSIHRDTIVRDGEGPLGTAYGTQKINAAFAFGGAPLTIRTMSWFLSTPEDGELDISHYAEVDMDGLAAVVDAVGGIDVDLPIDVKDPRYTGLNLSAGEQHIDGETAALLCRARHAYDSYGDGDLYRAANQRLVIRAVIEKVLASDPVTMASTLTAMADMITTDMDVASIIALANQMRGIDVSSDIMTGMEPTEGLFENELWYEVTLPYWETMKKYFRAGQPLYDGTSYDPSQGVSAEMTNGRDSGEVPATTTTADSNEEESSSDTSSSSYSSSYNDDGDYDSDYYYDESSDDGYYDGGYDESSDDGYSDEDSGY